MVGIVDSLGAGDEGIHVGDRVADMPVSGAYSQYLVVPARNAVPVPAGIAAAAAIEVPLMWVTAFQMLTRITPLAPGSPILVVRTSGAVGRALVLLGRHLGHRVIGTCSAGNMGLVEGLGAVAIDHRRPDLVDAVLAAGNGGGVAAAFDAIGGTIWDLSWQALAPGGWLIAYGFQDFPDFGGPPDTAAQAMQKLTRIWPMAAEQDDTHRRTSFYDIRTRRESHPDDYREDAMHLLALMAAGTVLPPDAELLPLDRAAEAHRRIASGGLDRRLVLIP